MAFDNILSVSGKSGLYRLVGQMKNGIIVESLEDDKRFPVYGSAKVSALDEISIYTEDEEIPLRDVFVKMFESTSGKQTVSHKDKDEVKTFFESIVPKYDRDRVYVSDMVKVIKWFNTLMEFKAFDPKDLEEKSEEATEGDEKKETAAKPKKAAPKKAAKKVATAKPKGGASSAKGATRKSGGAQRGG